MLSILILFADTFVEDFFLTYPSFMSLDDLCEGLLGRYTGQPEEGTDQPSDAGKEGGGEGGEQRRVTDSAGSTPASADEILRKRK